MGKQLKKHKKILYISTFLSLFSIFTILFSVMMYYLSDKIIHAQVLDQKIFIQNKQTAETKLQDGLVIPKEISVAIKTPNNIENYKIDLRSLDFKIDYEKTLKIAKDYSNLKNIFKPNIVSIEYYYNKEKLNEQLALIAGQLYIPPVYPTINSEKGSLIVEKGDVGYEVNVEKLENEIVNRMSSLSTNPINIQMDTVGQVLGVSDESQIIENYNLLNEKSIELVYENYQKILNQDDLIKIISNVSGYEKSPVELLIDEIASQIEKQPKEPSFIEKDGKVVEFIPATKGIKINQDSLREEMSKAIDELVNNDIDTISVEIKTIYSEPKIKTSEVNNYGINELIGKGSSKFVGSIPNRVHNVALAASKINGTLVAPGETFSFNKTIGDISVYTGFKQSYVIQGNQTVLGDGGGVCQVSTTLFRAALNAGLPISERRAHSYRVGYYEQESPVGLDATIYSPTVDLKITNDTPNHMLIQAYVDTSKMTLEIDIYGTKDGRVVTLTKPVITSQSPAPEPLYIDDPSKPAGYLEQIDYAAGGARVEYDYKVERDGDILIDKTFYSNYRPWQAKFIRGTGPTQ